MRSKLISMFCIASIVVLGSTTGCAAATGQTAQNANQYSLEQAMSDNAQLSTIAFSGLAFITGSSGADTFMPPGKVADFFGFQYMRDVDIAGYGHNTTFLSKAANNVLYILNDEQKAKLIALAEEQAPLYVSFAYNRFPIMDAFRRSLEKDIPSGSEGLDIQAVADYTAGLYKTDAELSYNRAVVVGEIINSFTDEQIAYFDAMDFNDYSSWPERTENDEIKKSMSNTEFVAVMTYASELFSWYKGSVEADVYFCPERHGTYFGGFYMKDYPAMNNPDYFISTAITGDSGQGFLSVLNSTQKALITGIIEEQRSALEEIGEIRTTVSNELRKAISGETIDKEEVFTLIERYGELDGQISALYATRFSEVNSTLTDTQRAALVKLRNLDVVPQGAYFFSTPVAMPEIPNTDFMFGIGEVPDDAGQATAPASFGTAPQGTGDPQKAKPIRVTLNGKDIAFDVSPIIKDGRTLVPFRSIAEALGATVEWDQASSMVKMAKGVSTINLIVGNTTAQVDGKSNVMDVPAQIVSGRTIVPLRFISEAFNLDVKWDQKTMTVTIANN